MAPAVAASIGTVSDNVAPGTGPVASGGTTNDNTLGLSGTLSGALAADEVVVIYDGATRLGVATVAGTSWSLNTPSLANGSHALSAQVEDAAGNKGNLSAAFPVTLCLKCYAISCLPCGTFIPFSSFMPILTALTPNRQVHQRSRTWIDGFFPDSINL